MEMNINIKKLIHFGNMKLHGNPFCDFKELGCPYKNMHISAATHHRILNLVPNQFLDIAILFGGWKCKLSNIHIHDY